MSEPASPGEETAGARLAKNATLYTLGIAATRFANLLLLPLYLSMLSKEEYGALGVLEQLVQLLVILTMAGGLEALLKVGTDVREPEAQLRLVTTMTTWMLLCGVAVAGLCALAWPWINNGLGGIALWPMGAIALSAIAGSAAFQCLSAHLQLKEQAKKHTLYAAMRTLLNVAIAVPLLVFTDLGVKALLIAMSSSYWLGTLVLGAQLRRDIRALPLLDAALLRRVLSYGVPLLPHLLASLVLQAADKFMLSASDAHGLQAVAVYSVGSRISSGVMMLGLGMQRAWLPYFFKETAEGAHADDRQAAQATHEGWQRVRRLSFWSMAGMASAVSVLVLLAPELVDLIAPDGYGAAALVTGVLCFSSLVRTGAQMSSAVVLNSDRAHTIWLASAPAAAIHVALNVVLIARYGAIGAAWSVVIGMTLNLLFTLALARRVRSVPFRYGAIALLMLATLALVVATNGAPLFVRLPLCALLPLLAFALDARFALAKVRSLISSPPPNGNAP